MTEYLQLDTYYVLRDIPRLEGTPLRSIRARWTGEKRPPKKGEWYLSGAKIGAYCAPNDLSTSFPIAEIVEIKETVVQTVERIVIPKRST